MRIVTPTQMLTIDEFTINKTGIPGIVLMENAAIGVINKIEENFGDVLGISICVVAGLGNNGGDAFAIARHLFNKGSNITVFLVGKADKLKGDTLINYTILQNMGITVTELSHITTFEYFKKSIKDSKILIDGLFGTGLNKDITGTFQQVIELINSRENTGVFVISLDIPSGINGESGKVMGIAVKSDLTVTFGLIKQGLLLHPGYIYAGKVDVCDISIPEYILKQLELKRHFSQAEDIAKFIPKRRNDSHKGDYGKVLIITGSKGMTGAGCLTGMSVLKSGAGISYIAVPTSLSSIYNIAAIECIVISLEENDGILSANCIEQIKPWLAKVDSVVIGPGLSTNESISAIVENVIISSPVPVIVDADAITAISKDLDVLKKKRSVVILTPHSAEMARLIKSTSEKVNENRINFAMDFAKEYGVIIVLKGYRTIIAGANGEMWINSTGNSGMATAGSGDVLAGIIAGFVSQRFSVKENILVDYLDILEKTVAATYIHGLCGDLAAAELGPHGMIAGDILSRIPLAIKSLIETVQ